MEHLRIHRFPPGIFLVAKYMIRHGYRGGDRLLSLCKRLGLLDRVVRYPVALPITVDVPLDDEMYGPYDVMNYEHHLCDAVTKAADFDSPTLIDCRANIDLFSIHLATRLKLRQIIAIEPGPEYRSILLSNLGRLDVPVVARCSCAVSDFSGMGRLHSPDHDASSVARYLAPDPSGDIPVVEIDSLPFVTSGNLILKLDVEGGEMAALRGATRTLRAAAAVVVAIEAHPMVVRRTGIDPIKFLHFLRSIRPFSVSVAERPGFELCDDQDFFSQIDQTKSTLNLVFRSSTAPPP